MLARVENVLLGVEVGQLTFIAAVLAARPDSTPGNVFKCCAYETQVRGVRPGYWQVLLDLRGKGMGTYVFCRSGPTNKLKYTRWPLPAVKLWGVDA